MLEISVNKGIMTIRRILPIITLASLTMLLPGCYPTTEDAPLSGFVESRPAKQAKKTGLVVINVLDKDLYDDCHIAGSINIPFDQLDECIDSIDKDAQIVFYCSNYMCSSSEYAAKQLQKAGFENVAVYEGGTAEWFQLGLPIEGKSTASYLNKHIEPTPCQTQAYSVLTAKQLAQKMGIEISE